MPKIQRKTQKIFCGNADNDQLAVFGSMATGTPVYTNDIEELQENEAYSEGWEAATLEDKAPFMEEMNGLQYGLSKQIAYTLQEGIPEYDANTTYYIGSIVKALNDDKPILYSSIIDNNIGNALTDTSSWEELKLGGGSGFNLFDTKLSDHILEGNEAKGWALQGTYVYKEAVAGVRDGYPDFYNKVLEHYGNATETKKGYISSNINIVGGLINRKGVLSGFWGDRAFAYATLPQPFNPNTETWEMVFKFNLTDLSNNNTILDTSVQYDGLIFRITTAGKLNTYISSNGTSWNIASNQLGTYIFETNKDYWIKGIFDGTQYLFSYSTDGINFINDITIASTSTLYSGATGYVLGVARDFDELLTGELDLNECYINIGGSTWWQGTNKYEYKQSPNGLKFYDIAEKSTIDEAFNLTGFAWFYGVDTENERVFLPRNVWFDQLEANTSLVGDMAEAGLPDITGTFGVGENRGSASGAFYNYGNHDGDTQTGGNTDGLMAFSASRSNNIYGNSDTVQPNAVKKLLYICVGNTNVESAITDVIDVTTTENDTTPLFTGMYFDFTPNNLSWLKGGQQANSGGIYTTCYNELVNCLNGTNPYSLKVINIADMVSGTDYSEYWKVNQDEMYFVTPTKLSYGALTGGVGGNGKTLGLTNGEETAGLYQIATYGLSTRIDAYGEDVGLTTSGDYLTVNKSIGIPTDVTKSGIIAEESITAQLYFKVANAVQNLELLNVGEVMESLTNKCDVDLSNCTKPYIIEVSDKSILPSWYRIYSDGWCEQGGISDAGTITFLISFSDTNYTLVKTGQCNGKSGDYYGGANYNAGYYSKSVDNFVCYSNGQVKDYNWEAKGYIS